MSKRKGSNAERELAHMFHDNKWGVLRAAGSGCATMPSPDILAGNGERYVAIECKSIKDEKKYLHEDEVNQLKEFAKRFGAEPWVGIRFDYLTWFFIELSEVQKSKGKYYVITLAYARKNGKSFKELIGLFRQKRLV